jgi:two-component system, OmpR family, heavy metal sensor histidine kinase CusS
VHKPRTLRGQFAMWASAAALAGLAVFAVAAYVIVYLEESEEAEAGVADDPQEVAAETREHVLVALAIAAPVALGLSVAAATFASKRALASVDDVTRAAAAISVDRFDRRLEVPEHSAELRPLAIATNDLLDRLHRGYLALAAFSAEASHELRTPLAAVCSELEVDLRRPRTVEEWEASARTSLAELRRLTSVVESMLRFAQADAIRDADAKLIDLVEFVEELTAMHADAATKRGVHLRAELGTETPIVRGDADLLATALTNLVGNALRLTPEGGDVVVSLATEPGSATIHVDDSGPGLPADRSKLFVPFARSSDKGGVGLGLAIADRIAPRRPRRS